MNPLNLLKRLLSTIAAWRFQRGMYVNPMRSPRGYDHSEDM